ncbi:MAG: hypothetical protein HUJ80_07270 [Firmicutes bacterium]|nr:hypothetical protein [Bacillota bacterium]
MKHRKLIILASALVIALAITAGQTVLGADGAAGSAADPLVSKSYVDSLFSDVMDSVQQKLEEYRNGDFTPAEETPSQGSAVFQVVEVPAGTRVIGEEGTEMIVRSGYAYAIDNGVDGISDLTAGADLKGDTQIQKNHLLLIPRSDGRGIRCDGLCYVMIKGSYSFN